MFVLSLTTYQSQQQMNKQLIAAELISIRERCNFIAMPGDFNIEITILELFPVI